MPFAGYSGDFNYTNYTPLDSTGDNWDKFKSAYKNIRFAVQPQTQYQLTSQDMANAPGLSYRFFGDTSLWLGLLKYNGISDPISGVAVGLTLSIPTKADLVAYLAKQTNNQKTTITI